MGVKERKEREREQRRHVILESARNAFIKHGLAHATMDKIADEAELAKGTLYLYYRNRDELLLTLVAVDMEELIRLMDAVVRSKKSADIKLHKAVEAFYHFSRNNEFFYKAMTQVNIGELLKCGEKESEAVNHFKQLNQRLVDGMKTIIEDGVRDGTFFIDKPADYIVIQIILALKGTIMILSNAMIPPEWAQMSTEHILLDQIRLFTRGLTNPLPTKRKQSIS